MEWNGKWNGTEISVWNMEDARMEWNGRFQEWTGRQSSMLPYRFHTRFCALNWQKNTYRCRVVINNIVTEVFNFNIYGYYLSTNCGTWLFILRKQYTTYCIIVSTLQFAALMLQLTTLTGLTCLFVFLFFFEIENLPSPKFCFLTSSRKLVFVISFPFQLNFVSIFSFSANNNSLWC